MLKAPPPILHWASSELARRLGQETSGDFFGHEQFEDPVRKLRFLLACSRRSSGRSARHRRRLQLVKFIFEHRLVCGDQFFQRKLKVSAACFGEAAG